MQKFAQYAKNIARAKLNQYAAHPICKIWTVGFDRWTDLLQLQARGGRVTGTGSNSDGLGPRTPGTLAGCAGGPGGCQCGGPGRPDPGAAVAAAALAGPGPPARSVLTG